jgi:ABC-type Mn2+/Zn2+ transport system permease subunit
MDVLDFYWLNIVAGIILVFVLGTVGRHIVGRNQSMEIMLLGQEFQTSLLLATPLITLIESAEHDDHNTHLEALLTLVFVVLLHKIFSTFIKKYRSYRIEGAIIFIVLLMGLSHLIVLFSPLVEFHMVKGFLGDIVTVPRSESIFVIISSLFIYFLFLKTKEETKLDTIEIALFNRATKRRKTSFIFSTIVFLLMLLSVHLFGSLFTIGAMIIPSFIAAIMKLSEKKYFYLTILNSFSVIGAFLMLSIFDRLPTTVLILFFILFISLIYSFFAKRL